MLAIKLKRIGKKHQPAYRVVVAEKRSKATGRFVEDLGFYNPILKKSFVNNERTTYWISQGAAPTDPVYNLLVKGGVIKGKKRPVHKRKPVVAGSEKEENKKEELKPEVAAESSELPPEEKVEEKEEKVPVETESEPAVEK